MSWRFHFNSLYLALLFQVESVVCQQGLAFSSMFYFSVLNITFTAVFKRELKYSLHMYGVDVYVLSLD